MVQIPDDEVCSHGADGFRQLQVLDCVLYDLQVVRGWQLSGHSKPLCHFGCYTVHLQPEHLLTTMLYLKQ